MNLSTPSSVLSTNAPLITARESDTAAPSPFVTRCRQIAVHPDKATGLALYAVMLDKAQLTFRRGLRIEVRADGTGDEQEIRARMWPQAGAAFVDLRLPPAAMLDAWLERRFDAFARDHVDVDFYDFQKVGHLLGIEDVILQWPVPTEGAWRRTHASALASAIYDIGRGVTPVFLRTVLVNLARDVHAWAQRLPDLSASRHTVKIHGNNVPDVMQVLFDVAQKKEADNVPDGVEKREPSDRSDTTIESSPPQEVASHAKTNSKKKETPSAPQVKEAIPLSAVRERAHLWAKSVAAEPETHADAKALWPELERHEGRKSQEAAWDCALNACAQQSVDAAWLFVAKAHAEPYFISTAWAQKTLIPLGVPHHPVAKQRAADVLLRLAAESDAPIVWPKESQDGWLTLLSDEVTRLASLALAARVSLNCNDEGDVPLRPIVESFESEILQGYTRALRETSDKSVAYLPLLCVLFARKPAASLAKHLLPLERHGHLACMNVVSKVSAIFCARPELMIELPILRSNWQAALHEALPFCTTEMLNDVRQKATDKERATWAGLLSEAHRYYVALNTEQAGQALATLSESFQTFRASEEVDELLLVAGKPLIACLMLIGRDIEDPTQATLSAEQICSLQPLLRRCFPIRSQLATNGAAQKKLPADAVRVSIRNVLLSHSFFVPHLAKELSKTEETLSLEDETMTRHVIAPYVEQVFCALSFPPAVSQRPFAHLFSEQPRLRRALAYRLFHAWRHQTPKMVDGKKRVCCDRATLQKEMVAHTPDAPYYFLRRYTMRMTTAMVFDWLEHNIAFLDKYLAAGTYTSPVDENLWQQTLPALLAIIKRNSVVPWLMGEPAMGSLTTLFSRLPDANRRLWAARLTGLLCQRTHRSFYRPTEPIPEFYVLNADKSGVCLEHLLPIVVAMCRTLHPDSANALAHAFWRAADQATGGFQSLESCGKPRRLKRDASYALGEFLIGQRAEQRQGKHGIDLMTLEAPVWMTDALEGAQHQDGFYAFDRMVVRFDGELRKSVGEDRAPRYTQTAVGQSLVNHIRMMTPFLPREQLGALATEIVFYLETSATWLTPQTAQAFINTVDGYLKEDGLMTLTDARALCTAEEQEALRLLVRAKQHYARLVSNPDNEPLLARLRPLNEVAHDDAEFIAQFQRHDIELCRLFADYDTLQDASDYIDAISHEDDNQEDNGVHGAPYYALASTLVAAADMIRMWNSYLTGDGANETTVDAGEMPFGFPESVH